MADLAISIAEKLIEVIASEAITKICSTWGYKSQLEELRETVSTIRKVLLDADAKRDELSHQDRDYIRKLKDVVYDADDVFDEFLTLAELNQLGKLRKGGKFFSKVRRFFSSENQVGHAYRISREVKDIKMRLDTIAANHKKFKFDVDYKPLSKRRQETCSYVDAKDIIGREVDKEKVINSLLAPNGDDGDFRFLTIVGVGGLGKTALAQLVYNDEKLIKEFPSLRLWVCVSDQDGEHFDEKKILCKILELVSGEKFDSSCMLELLVNRFQERLRGKKYFLVLDDVWNEDREKWVNLKKFLMLGQGGSRILVTTRSEITSIIIGDKHAYKLKGLSEEDSWRLFQMSAFDKGHEHENHQEFVQVGLKVVEKCCSIPLAIKVVGSLLFGQDIKKWRSCAESGLAKIGKGDNRIMSILKLSYHNLEPSLKSCFTYCALFSKDYKMKKDMLISLWMSQGYIVSLEGHQSIEDAAEEHFSILLRRCFFQDVIKDECGDVMFVKIHDLMHDVAQEVGREEICVVTSRHSEDQSLKYKDVRHVHYVSVGYKCQDNSLCSSKIRSCIYWHLRSPLGERQIDNWVCLRVLDLSEFGSRSLPDSISKLLLLRYLNLSCASKLEVLPNSITELNNLQTLVLCGCKLLRELPKKFCNLIKLRHLNLLGCDTLTHMPSGMDKLTNLRVLTMFVVGKRISTDEQRDDELKAFKVLTKIKGDISILIGDNYVNDVKRMNDRGGGYLNRMEHLSGVAIQFGPIGISDNHECLLENMEPHSNLKSLTLEKYKGTTIPRWGRAEDDWAISFPYLVEIGLYDCFNLKHVPVLSKLPNLKSLKLMRLNNLEYMEKRSSSSSNSEVTLFFPSLKSLSFRFLPKLKGWWKRERLVVNDDDHLSRRRFSFPCLSKLTIYYCPDLTSFPPCPSLENLDLQLSNKRLQIMGKDDTIAGKPQEGVIKLGDYLKSLRAGCITRLRIEGDEEVGSLSEVGEDVIKRQASSLQDLTICRCYDLTTLSQVRGLEHLTALEDLRLWKNEQFGIEEDNDDEPWKSFHQRLRDLTLEELPNMTSLPKGMHYFTSLESLYLIDCVNLKALPEWISSLSSLHFLKIDSCPALKSLPEEMRDLTSLKILQIGKCPVLKERCKEPDGEDRPKIQHIPLIEMWLHN